MSGGFDVRPEPLIEFGNHLDELEGNIKGTAGMLGGCVMDIGMFGLIGQLFGAGASKWCAEAEGQLNTYAGTISDFSDKIREAAKKYESGEAAAGDSILRFNV